MYVSFGLVLSSFGLVLTLFSYYILLNVTLTALGIACILLGLTITLTPSNPMPKNVVKSMLESSCVNIEALLEELNVRGKATFAPPNDGHVKAFIPLTSNPDPPLTVELLNVPKRMLTETGGKPCLMLFPPGSELVKLSSINQESVLEDALRTVLVDLTEITKSVKAVRREDRVIVEFEDSRVKLDFPRFKESLGSLSTCISACVLATVLNAPVRVDKEKHDNGRVRVTFSVSG